MSDGFHGVLNLVQTPCKWHTVLSKCGPKHTAKVRNIRTKNLSKVNNTQLYLLTLLNNSYLLARRWLFVNHTDETVRKVRQEANQYIFIFKIQTREFEYQDSIIGVKCSETKTKKIWTQTSTVLCCGSRRQKQINESMTKCTKAVCQVYGLPTSHWHVILVFLFPLTLISFSSMCKSISRNLHS